MSQKLEKCTMTGKLGRSIIFQGRNARECDGSKWDRKAKHFN